MSDPSAPSLPIVRAAAVVLSLGLGLAVVVNAQFGCDAPTNAPPADGEKTPQAEPAAKVEAAKVEADASEDAKAEAAKVEADASEAAKAEAASDEPPARPASAEDANDTANPDKPVLMPASKSGGDFGAMRFPGQKDGKTGNKAKTKQAPNQAPVQQQQAPAQQTQQANHGG